MRGLLLAAGLTLFLPYYSVEQSSSITLDVRRDYTGIELVSGSYRDSSPSEAFADHAADGAVSASLVVAAAIVGLVVLPFRRFSPLAWLLIAGLLAVFIGGCASSFDLALFGSEFTTHWRYGFAVGIFCLLGATIFSVVLWRIPATDDAPAAAAADD